MERGIALPFRRRDGGERILQPLGGGKGEKRASGQPPKTVAIGIDTDFRQPWLKGHLVIIPGEVPKSLEPGVLVQVFGLLDTAAEGQAQAVEPSAILADIGIEHALTSFVSLIDTPFPCLRFIISHEIFI